jgi:hypothetical protein
VCLRELPAPVRVAPYAFAVGGSLSRDGDEEAASGRLVLLADAAGQSAWEGTVRFVCYTRAQIEAEFASDPLLPEVAWAWLGEALATHDVAVRAIGGTVTITSSRRFGVLAADGDSFDVELRCSWSPDWAETAYGGRQPWTAAGTVAYLAAFADLLGAMVGLPPHVNGVVPWPGQQG